MKNSTFKKFLVAALAGTMVFAACPTAYAADEATSEAEAVEEEATEEEATEEEAVVETADDGADESVYVLMNIPYDKFYDAEGDDAVDAVSSATLQKPRTNGLASGSYHVNADGSDITGITYAVKTDAAGLAAAEAKGGSIITDESSVDITTSNRGQTATTTYAGSDALFEAPSYSYYVLEEAPAAYKEMSVSKKGNLSFGATNATTTTINDADVTFATTSSYGDYQMTVNSLSYDDSRTVYGVILNTTDGSKYGLRHIENIWRQTSIAWSTGHTTNVHGCELNTSDYEDMEGKTISSITYLTSDGNYKLKLANYAYVAPYYTLTAKEVANDATKVAVSGIPSNARNVKVSVYYAEGRTMVYAAQNEKVVDGYVELDDALDAAQTYTVQVTSSNYATINATAMADNAITCTQSTKTYKYSTLKKKAQSFKLTATNTINAEMTFSKQSGNSKITVASDGTVTVKKGIKKGTYTVKATVKTEQSGKYNAASKTVTFKIKVK